MSKRDGYIQKIQFKARELGINPKLLMLAIATLAKDPSATEWNVFKSFFKELIKEAKEEAEKKAHSIYARQKEEGETALKPVNKQSEGFANSSIYGACQLNNLIDPGEIIMQLHYTAWNHIIDQQIKIKRMHGRKYIADDAVQIIKYLCPEEINLCRSLGYFIQA